MEKKTKFIIFILAVIVLIGGLGVWVEVVKKPKQNVSMGGYAKCVSESGAKFYGTFWCSHCQNQKKMFGEDAKYLPYIECSTPDGRGQTKECVDDGIEAYPTWIFKDGSKETGELPIEKLAEKTSCNIK